MKDRYLILFAILCLILAALACGEPTPEVRVEQPAAQPSPTPPPIPTAVGEQEQPAEEPAEPPAEEPGAVGTSRDNPAPYGSAVTIGDYTFLVGEVTRPANDIVAAGNQFNATPEPGNEFIMIGLSATCNLDSNETCNLIILELTLVGSTGIVREPNIFVAGVEGILEGGEFYGGATLSGRLIYEVQVGETNLVLIYEELFALFETKAFMQIP